MYNTIDYVAYVAASPWHNSIPIYKQERDESAGYCRMQNCSEANGMDAAHEAASVIRIEIPRLLHVPQECVDSQDARQGNKQTSMWNK